MTNNKNLGKRINNTQEHYFENSHKCVPFGLLIIKIIIFFIIIGRFYIYFE
jgi:hypothetical protein